MLGPLEVRAGSGELLVAHHVVTADGGVPAVRPHQRSEDPDRR
jgi:hypothetical protein